MASLISFTLKGSRAYERPFQYCWWYLQWLCSWYLMRTVSIAREVSFTLVMFIGAKHMFCKVLMAELYNILPQTAVGSLLAVCTSMT